MIRYDTVQYNIVLPTELQTQKMEPARDTLGIIYWYNLQKIMTCSNIYTTLVSVESMINDVSKKR